MGNPRKRRALTSVPSGAEASDWLRRFGALTSEREHGQPGDHVGDGSRVAVRCVELARALVSRPCPRHHLPRSQGSCALGVGPSVAQACLLAADLAGGEATPVDGDANEIAWSYMNALVEAAEAVYFCRRIAHPGGRCWFTEAGANPDVCGRVLTVAHGLRLPSA